MSKTSRRGFALFKANAPKLLRDHLQIGDRVTMNGARGTVVEVNPAAREARVSWTKLGAPLHTGSVESFDDLAIVFEGAPR